jgi:hypothetical protein
MAVSPSNLQKTGWMGDAGRLKLFVILQAFAHLSHFRERSSGAAAV